MSSNVKNLYKVLDVDSTCSTDDIKKAFIRLSKLHHPDKHDNSKESNEKFQLITEAYTTLSNPCKRKKYDTLLNGNVNCNETYRRVYNEQYYRNQEMYHYRARPFANFSGTKPLHRQLVSNSLIVVTLILVAFISGGLNIGLISNRLRSRSEYSEHRSRVLNKLFQYSKERARVNGRERQLRDLSNGELKSPSFKEMEKLVENDFKAHK